MDTRYKTHIVTPTNKTKQDQSKKSKMASNESKEEKGDGDTEGKEESKQCATVDIDDSGGFDDDF